MDKNASMEASRLSTVMNSPSKPSKIEENTLNNIRVSVKLNQGVSTHGSSRQMHSGVNTDFYDTH